jgi:hypothetical protein
MNEIVDNIADKLDWKKQGVLWFSDIDTNTTLKNEMTMNIYLTDRKTYDLNAPNLASTNNMLKIKKIYTVVLT